MKLSPLALAVALTPAAQAFAESPATDPTVSLPALVVTASRQAEPRSAATTANTVFERADIERLQARSVPELLARVPGMVLGNSGGVPAYFLRGSSSAQTLVLVDGQRIASATSGIARLDYLAIDSVERVEVIRGPRSALYGADAIGGVIQIFTRTGAPGLSPQVRVAAGSHGTVERSLNLAGGDGQTRYNLGASLDESRGFDRTSDDQGADRDRDGLRNRALHLNVEHRLNARLAAGFSLNDQRGENEYDDAYEFVPGLPQDEFRLSSYSAHLDGRLAEAWDSRLELGRSFDRNKAIGASSFWNDGFLETTRHSASWINHLRPAPGHRLTLGGDWYEDRLDASTAYAEDRRTNRALFAQHGFEHERFTTELGLRHDDNQRYGSENTWNAALSLPTGQAQRWTLSYGEGFRAPTFSDLYYPGAGNPDLSPETSRTWELQWRGEQAAWQLEASAYRTDIDDLIAWNNSTFRPENVARARIDGIEVGLGHDLLGWQARWGLSVIDPRDRDNGHTLALRARRSLSLDLDRTFGDIDLGASWRAVSRRYADAANTRELAGYGEVDLRAAWQSTPSLRWELKLNNLLDRGYALSSYQRPTGPSWLDPSRTLPYEEEGRSALLALIWTPTL